MANHMTQRGSNRMNDALNEFARKLLKDGLAKCTDAEQLLFKRMYAKPPLPRDENTIEWLKSVGFDHVVDDMDDDRLCRAMEQVEATLVKKEGKATQ